MLETSLYMDKPCLPLSEFYKHFIFLSSLTRSQSRRVQGPAFKLTEAVPVDLFPHTYHFELIMKFERDTKKKTTDNSGTQAASAESESKGNAKTAPESESGDSKPGIGELGAADTESNKIDDPVKGNESGVCENPSQILNEAGSLGDTTIGGDSKMDCDEKSNENPS